MAKPTQAPLIHVSRTVPTAHGKTTYTLGSKDGKTGGLQVRDEHFPLPGGRCDESVFRVTTPEAIAEFQAKAAEDNADFGEEKNFADWAHFVYLERPDVQIIV